MMLAKLTEMIAAFQDEERGASMVEYALLVVLIAIIAIVAITLAGDRDLVDVLGHRVKPRAVI